MPHQFNWLQKKYLQKGILVSLRKEYKLRNLCLAGGVALNCVANGIIKEKIFDNIWIQPVVDAGGSLVCIGVMVHALGEKMPK